MANGEPRRIVFLCSGGGGNLRFLHQVIVRGWLENVEIAAVLTDRPCPANSFAMAVGIPELVIDFSSDDQSDLLRALDRFGADLVVTTVHRILRSAVVDRYRGRLINLHYSLLPAFAGSIGVRPVQAAIDHGARFTGVTVHFVDESVDGGKPIVQAVIPLAAKEEDFPGVMNVVFRCGCIALMESIRQILCSGEVPPASAQPLLGRLCVFNSGGVLASGLSDDFWTIVAMQES